MTPRTPASSLSTVTFRQVMARTGAFLTVRWQPVLVGVLSFSLMVAVMSAFVHSRVQRVEDRLAAGFGMTWEELGNSVDATLATLTQSGALAIASAAESIQWQSDPAVIRAAIPDPAHAATVGYILGVGPWALLTVASFVCIAFVAWVFFLLLATSGLQSAYDATQRLPATVVRMAFLFFWMLVRSFLWVPLLGPVLALYFVPRIALAPVFLASGETGVLRSVQESVQRTRGSWWTVVFILLGIGLMLFLMLWGGLVLIAVVAIFSLKLASLLWFLAVMYVAAVGAVALTMLAASMG